MAKQAFENKWMILCSNMCIAFLDKIDKDTSMAGFDVRDVDFEEGRKE